MPPKKLSKVAQLQLKKKLDAAKSITSDSNASTSNAASSIESSPTASTSDLPSAKTLPSEPMDLNGIEESGEGSTEMADVADKVLSNNQVDEEQPPSSKTLNGLDKGKGKARMEMNNMQNVSDLNSLSSFGMDGMEQDIWKGKALTDNIKNVVVSSIPSIQNDSIFFYSTFFCLLFFFSNFFFLISSSRRINGIYYQLS